MLAEDSMVNRSASVGCEFVNGEGLDSLLFCDIMSCSWRDADTAKGKINRRRCDRRMVMMRW